MLFTPFIESFRKLTLTFSTPRTAWRVVVAVLCLHTGLLMYSAHVHSPTLNEPGHIVAGLSHWKFGRFELYRVNPPLVRMVAALPVIAVGYEEDWSGFYEGPGARPIFEMGVDWVTANGERSYWLLTLARWACIPFSLLGAIVCYLWARDLFGTLAGIFACVLWCFSPNILGHASLITADVHATSLGVAACYTFWRWLRKPTWAQAALTGCVLGLAELTKTTLILFYPLWPLLWIAYRWSDRSSMLRQDWLREAGMLLLRMLIGLYILNLGYGYEDSLKPLEEFHFVSELFTAETDEFESTDVQATPSTRDSQPATRNSSTNRFAGTWLGKVPVPFPKNYLIGIDLQQKDFENFGRPSYLRGEFQDRGWWYYYLYALTIKVPVGTWLLACLIVAWYLFRCGPGVAWRDVLILLLPPLLILAVVSSKTGFSHHMRYLFPCFPFVFIWLGQVAAVFEAKDAARAKVKANWISNVSAAGVILALSWSLVSSLSIYPHNISYFNELAGGPIGGPQHLINSNVDWGQDLLQLKWWREAQTKTEGESPFYLAYYGYLEPADIGFADALPWPGEAKQDKAEAPEAESDVAQDLPALTPGHYAISINFLQGYPWPARDGAKEGRKRLSLPVVEQFRQQEPCGRAGYSLLVYKID